MSKKAGGVHHKSADAADKFEEHLEGEDFGSLDDWETDLSLKILKIESKLADGVESSNGAVFRLLTRKLVTYNAALSFLDENPKAAAMVGSQGGLHAIISYITKQAVEDAAKDEVKKYSDRLKVYLPGYVLSKTTKESGGLEKLRKAQKSTRGGRDDVTETE
jgi:hypothetical protein